MSTNARMSQQESFAPAPGWGTISRLGGASMPGQTQSRSLGSAIRERRRELGWTQEDLATRMVEHGDTAFRQSDVSRLELGKVELPHRGRLCHLAAVLELSLGQLLTRSGWSGAETAFVAENAPRSAGTEPNSPEVGSARWHSERPLSVAETQGEILPSTDDLRRLREAIAVAQDTRSHTHMILAQSRALLERTARSRRTPSADRGTARR
jgi:transcriptional regulator with XRE-family HTH domain